MPINFIRDFARLGLSFRFKLNNTQVLFSKGNALAFVLVKTGTNEWELVAKDYQFTKLELNLIWRFIEELERGTTL